MSKLKSCPFCGGRAFMQCTKERIGDSYRAYCGDEDCPIEPRTHWYFKREQAVEAWNRRYPNEDPETRHG